MCRLGGSDGPCAESGRESSSGCSSFQGAHPMTSRIRDRPKLS
jgi:hypothetical protein